MYTKPAWEGHICITSVISYYSICWTGLIEKFKSIICYISHLAEKLQIFQVEVKIQI